MKITTKFLRFLPVLALAGILPGCGSDSGSSPSEATGLVKEDVTVGTGATAVNGDRVTVSYVGSFTDGRTFDQGTFSFTLGTGAVIPGFDQGVNGMRVGGRRRITVPPSLGYGSQGSPPTIPGNATLRFDITLISILGK